ncbi:N-acetyltransferase [bacterium]|nr:N-acetyltransferase [bacterium]
MTVLKTNRLVLRNWKEEDFPAFAKLNSDPRVMVYLAKYTKEESDNLAIRNKEKIDKEGWGRWAVSLRDSEEFIGTIGIYPLDHETYPLPFTPTVAVGWRIAFEHWGKGYATEGAKAVLDYGFKVLQLEEIVAFCHHEHVASMHVMEKLGMHRNPKDDFDADPFFKKLSVGRQVLYRITKKEWENRSNNP